MRFLETLTCTLVGAAFANAISTPDTSLESRDESGMAMVAKEALQQRSAEAKTSLLQKRRRGSRGGGGGSRRGSRGGSRRPRLPTRPRRPRGGNTIGQGTFLKGGSIVSYRSGQNSPSGIQPSRVTAAGAAAIFPGTWGAGVYVYSYTLDEDDLDETELDGDFLDDLDDPVPVRCLCEEFLECSCEEENDEDYLQFLIDDDDVDDLDEEVVAFNTVDGTTTLVINGTMPNATEFLGDDSDDDSDSILFDDSDDDDSNASIKQTAVQLSGWSFVAGVVALMVVAV